MTIAPSPFRFPTARRDRAGLSLLEVLIACGILALGLAGVAAMLPAAGMRLGEATVADRARFVAANAHADMLNRGLTIAASSGGAGCVAFGQVATASGTQASTVSAANVGNRIDTSSDFAMQDDLVYGTGPVNGWVNPLGSPSRAYRDSLVWGATLTPAVSPAQPGGSATLSIVVFRRPGEAKLVTLTKAADGSWLCAEADRSRFLKTCSAVLLVAVDSANVRPAWLSVRASWGGVTILAADAVPDVAAASSISVIGFENVVRVEHHAVTLR